MALRLQSAVLGRGRPLPLLKSSRGALSTPLCPSSVRSLALLARPSLVQRPRQGSSSVGARFIHTSFSLRQQQQQQWQEDGKEKQQQQTTTTPPNSKPPLRERARAVSEDILTIPNVLTTMRLLSTPLLGYLIVVDEMRYALMLLAASGFTDVLDGWLARRYNSSTVFGSIADPAADKALMTVMVGALAWRGLIPVPLVVLIVGRDLALVASAFVIRYRTLEPPKTMERYWDPRLPSAQVQPTQVSKYNTFLQLVLVAGCTVIAALDDEWSAWWDDAEGLWGQGQGRGRIEGDEESESVEQRVELRAKDVAKKAWHAFMGVVAATTLWSGASYLSGSGAVKLSKLVKNKSTSSP